MTLALRRWRQEDQEFPGVWETKPDSKTWRDGSAAKSISCSSRGAGFNSQHPHGGSPGIHVHTCKKNTHKHRKMINCCGIFELCENAAEVLKSLQPIARQEV